MQKRGLPYKSFLFWHSPVFCGHAGQDAGGATSLRAPDAHEVPWSDNVTGGSGRLLVGDHCVLSNLLENLDSLELKC